MKIKIFLVLITVVGLCRSAEAKVYQNTKQLVEDALANAPDSILIVNDKLSFTINTEGQTIKIIDSQSINSKKVLDYYTSFIKSSQLNFNDSIITVNIDHKLQIDTSLYQDLYYETRLDAPSLKNFDKQFILDGKMYEPSLFINYNDLLFLVNKSLKSNGIETSFSGRIYFTKGVPSQFLIYFSDYSVKINDLIQESVFTTLNNFLLLRDTIYDNYFLDFSYQHLEKISKQNYAKVFLARRVKQKEFKQIANFLLASNLALDSTTAAIREIKNYTDLLQLPNIKSKYRDTEFTTYKLMHSDFLKDIKAKRTNTLAITDFEELYPPLWNNSPTNLLPLESKYVFQLLWLMHISENFHTPEFARLHNIQGKTIARITVNPEGYFSKIEITKSVDFALDDELIRVIKMIPKFSPATKDGRAVAYTFDMPVNVILEQ